MIREGFLERICNSAAGEMQFCRAISTAFLRDTGGKKRKRILWRALPITYFFVIRCMVGRSYRFELCRASIFPPV